MFHPTASSRRRPGPTRPPKSGVLANDATQAIGVIPAIGFIPCGVVNDLAFRESYKQEWSVVVLNQGGSGNLAGLDLCEKGERRRLPVFETALRAEANAGLLRDNAVVFTPKQLGVFTVSAQWRGLDAYQVGRHVLIKTSGYGIDINTGKAFLVIGTRERGDGYVTLTLLSDIDAFVPYSP